MKITKFISLYPYWQIPATVSKNREVILPQFRVIKQDLWPFLRICVFRIWIPLIIYNENPRKHMIWRILYPEYNTLWRLDSMPSSTWTMYRIQILDIELALYFFLFFFSNSIRNFFGNHTSGWVWDYWRWSDRWGLYLDRNVILIERQKSSVWNSFSA